MSDSDYTTGTYSNWTGAPAADFTLDKLIDTARDVAKLGPVCDDITVAPNLMKQALKLAAETSSPLGGAVRVWEDASLPPGSWHKGKPLLEQLRTAPLSPVPIFSEPFTQRLYW